MQDLLNRFSEENDITFEEKEILRKKFLSNTFNENQIESDIDQIKLSLDQKKQQLQDLEEQSKFLNFLTNSESMFKEKQLDTNKQYFKKNIELNSLYNFDTNDCMVSLEKNAEGNVFSGVQLYQNTNEFFQEKKLESETKFECLFSVENTQNENNENSENSNDNNDIYNHLLKFRNVQINKFWNLKLENEGFLENLVKRRSLILKKIENLYHIKDASLVKELVKNMKIEEKKHLSINIDSVYNQEILEKMNFQQNFQEIFDSTQIKNDENRSNDNKMNWRSKLDTIKNLMNVILSRGKRLCEFLNQVISSEVGKCLDEISTFLEELKGEDRPVIAIDRSLLRIWKDSGCPSEKSWENMKTSFLSFEKGKKMIEDLTQQIYTSEDYKKQCYKYSRSTDTKSQKNTQDQCKPDEFDFIQEQLKKAEEYQEQIDSKMALYNKLRYNILN